MSSRTTPSAMPTSAPSWRLRDVGSGPLVDPPPGAAVIGVGESAHFVAELNAVRIEVAVDLVRRGVVTHLALELGDDEAPLIQPWLRGLDDRPLRDVVGPLTHLLYGTVLTGLRDALEPDQVPEVLGVDLPTSLTIEPSLAPLADLLARLDPDSADAVARARTLASGVVGGSAAASATSWLSMDPATQDRLTIALARLAARVEALAAVHAGTEQDPDWQAAVVHARAARSTDLMLRAMAELFSGEGVPADTTLREHHVSERLLAAVDGLGPDERILYLAHDNHLQKAPVVFDGELAAYPVGQVLAARLGPRYHAVALTHLGPDVPEMVVPAPTSVGFSVEVVAAAPVEDGSLEAVASGDSSEPVRVLGPTGAAPAGATTSIRSQSAVAEIPADAFDAVLVVPRATLDRAAEGLRG